MLISRMDKSLGRTPAIRQQVLVFVLTTSGWARPIFLIIRVNAMGLGAIIGHFPRHDYEAIAGSLLECV
jgi:hypothetical protein